MRTGSFRDRFRAIGRKVEDLEKLQGRLSKTAIELDQRVRRNETNTRQIIDEYLREQRAELRRKEFRARESIADAREEIRSKEIQLAEYEKFLENQRAQDSEAIHRLLKEKSQGFPWLADVVGDYHRLRDEQLADYLEEKIPPAIKGAEAVRLVGAEKKELRRKYEVTRYLLEYYESLFPWLVDFRGEDLDDLIERTLNPESREETQGSEEFDPACRFLTEAEYEKLTTAEKYQRALDRYWQKRKSPWEIGRDYERYVGYRYEHKGYSVFYQGIVQGLEDLGRDLVAKKGSEVAVIQCKCWSRHKTIHEKHVCQLFGTTLKYWVENQRALREGSGDQQFLFTEVIRSKQVKGVFITSTTLSPTAREFAEELGILVKEQFPMKPYPSVKCNISRSNGARIYHLPFDQQYDTTIIEQEKGERYVETVAEAEALGFRRAYRWRGGRGDT